MLGQKETKINENTTLLDTLYGGVAGQIPITDIQDIQDFLNLSDSETKQSQTSPKFNFEVIPPHQALAAITDDQVDIRPRFFDKNSQQYVLLDTGAQ